MKNRFFIVILFVNIVFAQTNIQQQINTLTRAAQIYERDGQVDKAISLYTQICHLKPSHLNSYLGARRLLIRKNDWAQYKDLLLFLDEHNNDVRYDIDLAFVDYKSGNEKKAIKRWDEIISQNPKDHTVFSLIGRHLLDLHLLNEARDLYLTGRQALNNRTLYTFELAAIYTTQEKYKLLLQEYLNFLQNNPLQINYIEGEVDRLCNEESRIPRLLFSLQNLKNENFQPEWAVLLLQGNLYVENAKFENALKSYEQLEMMLSDKKLAKDVRNYSPGKYMYKVGTIAMQTHNWQIAEKAFLLLREKFNNSPFFDNTQMNLAKIYTEQKNYDKAISFLQNYTEITTVGLRAMEALIGIGDIYFYELWDLDKAFLTYQSVLENPQAKIANQARLKISECLIAKNDLDKARGYLTAVEKVNIKNKNREYYEALFRIAKLDFYAQKPATALKKLSQLFAVDAKIPGDLENDALEFSILLTENIFDSTACARFGYAELLYQQRAYEQSVEYISAYLEENPLTPIQDELYLLACKNFEQLAKPTPAIELYQKLYSNENSVYRDLALFKMAGLYKKQQKTELAINSYEKILIEFPASLYIETARKQILTLESNE